MRKLLVGAASALVLALAAGPPAFANNDPLAPADDCDSAQGNAIGHPNDPSTATNGPDIIEARTGDPDANPVDAPASRSNPGNAVTDNDTSADGQANSEAPDHCANAGG